jgi:hypothetical protein
MVEAMSQSQSHPDPARPSQPQPPGSSTGSTTATAPPESTSTRDASSGEHTRPIPTSEGRGGALQPTATGTRSREQDAALREERAEEARREQFGGYNPGADFFGWLVAIALSVLLASIVGAVVTAVSANLQVDQTEAERRAGTIGLATAIALLVILMIGYYAGGYVAGRMSRFDGGRQGAGVWLIGLFVTIVAIGLGAVFGSQYNILDRVDLPSIPIPRDTLTGGGIVSAVAILIGTLLAAIAGGKVGQRYHRKVDEAGL